MRLLIHNDAIKNDPPEIYGWRVYALALSVGLEMLLDMLAELTSAGLLRRNVIWNGQ